MRISAKSNAHYSNNFALRYQTRKCLFSKAPNYCFSHYNKYVAHKINKRSLKRVSAHYIDRIFDLFHFEMKPKVLVADAAVNARSGVKNVLGNSTVMCKRQFRV